MRCKDAKHLIRKLQQQLWATDVRLGEMRDEIDRLKHEVKGEHVYRFDQLEIIVRPHGTHTVFRPVFDDQLRVDLTVWGNDQCPTIHNHRVVALGALDLIRERKEYFIRDMGEIMVREILAFGEERGMRNE